MPAVSPYRYPEPAPETVAWIRQLGDDDSSVRLTALHRLLTDSQPWLDWVRRDAGGELRYSYPWFVGIMYRACANAYTRYTPRGSVDYCEPDDLLTCVHVQFARFCAGPDHGGLRVALGPTPWEKLGQHLEYEVAKSCLLADIAKRPGVNLVLTRAAKDLEAAKTRLVQMQRVHAAGGTWPPPFDRLLREHGPAAVEAAVAILVSGFDPAHPPSLGAAEKRLAADVLRAAASVPLAAQE